MSEKKNLRSVNELDTWKPAEVQAWLDSVLSNREELPKDFNCLLLAEYAGQLARRSDDLEWARVSTRVYDWLHRVDLDGNDSSMALRVYFINKRGSVSGDPLLDPNVILRWFYENLPISFTEAELGIPKCKETIAKGNIKGPDVLQLCRELRNIKNKLTIINWMVERDTLHPDEDLSKWLDIRVTLP